jgi:hypothetical protein
VSYLIVATAIGITFCAMAVAPSLWPTRETRKEQQ